jgi:hypothetical protein
MRFVETSIFTKQVKTWLEDDEYRALQNALALRPDSAPIIPGSEGLRKLRWIRPGMGKRGGLRVIFYWDQTTETFYMLFLYPKNAQENLTMAQMKVLRNLIREEFK